MGEETAWSPVDTIIFYNGLYFALRGGKEQHELRREPCQIEIVEPAGKRAFLRYTEDISKNYPGGLKGRKVSPKIVVQHANLADPDR